MNRQQKLEEANRKTKEQWNRWSEKGYVDFIFWLTIILAALFISFVTYILFTDIDFVYKRTYNWDSGKLINVDKTIDLSKVWSLLFPLLTLLAIVPMFNKYRKKNIHKLDH